jgi:uncharacterized protein (TIGR02646 family)
MLRKVVPRRSAVAKQAVYTAYRASLTADFNSRCGYCDASDDPEWGRGRYHIDHFAPHSKFPDLKEEYSNLVYACPWCNRAKSNKWIGATHDVHNDGASGFIDPCTNDYDDHVMRHTDGQIRAVTVLGAYIIRELKLHLMRHQLTWQSEAFLSLRNRIDELIDNPEVPKDRRMELLEQFRELTKSYDSTRRAAAR